MKIYTNEDLKWDAPNVRHFKRFGVRRTPTSNRHWYLTPKKLI